MLHSTECSWAMFAEAEDKIFQLLSFYSYSVVLAYTNRRSTSLMVCTGVATSCEYSKSDWCPAFDWG